MRRDLMIYACMSVVLACQGAEEKNGNLPVDLSEPGIELDVAEENEVDSANATELQEISFEEAQGIEDFIDDETDSDKQKKENSTEVPADSGVNSTEASMEDSDVVKIPSTDKAVQEVKSILITVVPDIMKFDTEVFTVAAGQKVILELDNPDGMQHNLVISKPGTLKEVGAAADALARDPKGAQKGYVPEIPAVLFATELLEPGEVVTIKFTAPSEPGDYPFVCTFPGHWRMMNGIMRVTK